VGGHQALFLLDSSSPPKLYVASGGKRDLSHEPAFPGKPLQGMIVYGPISLNTPGKDTTRITFSIETFVGRQGPTYIIMCLAGYRSGTVQLNGESYKVAVADANFDGRYDRVLGFPLSLASKPHCNMIAFDLNNNGHFDFSPKDPEIWPLTKMIEVKGTYYSVNIATDGSSISMEKVTPQFGTLDVGHPKAELSLFSESGPHHLKDSGGKWQLPAGKYAAWQIQLTRTDTAGAEWILSSGRVTGELQNFEILPGQTLTAKLGTPLTVKTDVAQQGDSVSIGLSLLEQSGVEYTPGAQKNGQRVPEPRLKILDEAGKILASGKFEYG
jgi:hypothetical protein